MKHHQIMISVTPLSLPIFQEYEIDKTLGIKGSEDVEKMGIAAYNAECRKIVMRYAKEWQDIVSRLGRWIGCSIFLLLFPLCTELVSIYFYYSCRF